MYVIGTAGHVDHGKSRLVRALTGIDPDRLAEEKTRGLTIDLGFAWLTLPSSREVSIVDVPGHERFIKNMLAGVGGIDLALLVVAADEGVMPQTREHLAILDLLEVTHGVVALTKRDLVDRDWLDLVEAEVQETIARTSLSGSSIVRCSGETGDGLATLRTALDEALEHLPPKRDVGRPRLPIDRAFTISGFGTVVTGTLIDGVLHVGDQVALVPGGIQARVRGLQNHGRNVDAAEPGTRTAVNLSGVSTSDLPRGTVLTTPDWLQPTTAIDVRLRVTPDAPRPIKHNARVSFHCGAAEAQARIRLLEQEHLEPDAAGWAQIRLEESIAVARGDFFIVRATDATIGGGRVVDSRARRHRRSDPATTAALELLLAGGADETVLTHLQRMEPAPLAELGRRSELEARTLRDAVERQVANETIVHLGDGPLHDASLLITSAGHAALVKRARSFVQAFVDDHPLRPGIPREELRSRLGHSAKTYTALEQSFVRRGALVVRGGALDLPDRIVTLSQDQRETADRFLAALRNGGTQPPASSTIEPELLSYMEARREIVRVAEGLYFDPVAHKALTARITAMLAERGEITLAEVRDLLRTSRKYAQAILEDLDRRRITRRVGDVRVLREATRKAQTER